MIENRKTEEFKDDRKKWKIYFDLETDHRKGDSNILVSFVIAKNHPLFESDLKNLKQDLGKLRIIKQGREFLGE